MKSLFRTAAVVVSLALPTATVLAQDTSSKNLDEFAARARIAQQALKENVDSAISRASKLPKELALLALDQAENDVQDATYLSTTDRKVLLDQVAQKRKLVSLATGRTADPSFSPRPPKHDAHEEYIRNELAAIHTLSEQGQIGLAQARRKALAERYPTHPALTAESTLGGRRDAASDYHRITDQRNRNITQVHTDTEGLMGKGVTGDVTYDPKVWAQASKREPAGAPVFSGRERDLLKRLDEKTQTDISFNNTTFDQVLKTLEKELGVTLVIGKTTMDEVRVAYDSPLTFQMPKGVSKRNLLKSILSELGLTYVIKAETLQVVSVLQAKNELSTGFMDVGTIISRGGSPDDLIRMIKSQIDSTSWDTGGGNGTITYQPPGTLIIRNSAEIIYRLGARKR